MLNCVVDSPAIWPVDNFVMSRMSRFVAGREFSCEAVRPCTWAVVRLESCVVEKLPSAVVVSEPTCFAVRALAWAALKACSSVEVRLPIWVAVKAAT